METESKKSLEDEASDKNHEAYGRGVKLFEQSFYSLAKNEFKAALDYWPEDHQAWMALGNCFDEMKKPIRAEKCFRKALIFCFEQERSGIYFNLGNSLLDQYRLEEAIESYQKVTAQSPAYRAAQINMKRAIDERC